MNSIATITQGYAVAQQSGADVESILPMNNLLRELAEDYNISATESASSAEDVKTEVDALKDDLIGRQKALTTNPQVE